MRWLDPGGLGQKWLIIRGYSWLRFRKFPQASDHFYIAIKVLITLAPSKGTISNMFMIVPRHSFLSLFFFIWFLRCGCSNDGLFSVDHTWLPGVHPWQLCLFQSLHLLQKIRYFLLGQFSLGQMQLEMQILQTRILTIEPILLMISHWFSCRLGTPTTIGLSLIMEPSALTRTFCPIFGIRMSRSNAIKLCVHIT